MQEAAQPTIDTLPGFCRHAGRELFVIESRPAGSMPEKAVLVVPPFAEEMNRSRRMMHLLSRRMAALGLRGVRPDLSGTGESDGELASSDWATWVDDLTAVADEVRRDSRIVAVVGIRLGALLALSAADRMAADRMVLWEPVASGRAQVDELLRLRVMADRFATRGPASSIETLRGSLQRQDRLRVAGYELGSRLVGSLDGVTLEGLLAASVKPVHIFRLGEPATKPSAIAGTGVADETFVPGPRFWAGVETTCAPALLDATENLVNG